MTATVLRIVIGLLLAAGFTVLASAKIRRTESMRERAAHLGFSSRAYGAIGVLELAGAAGLVVGLWVPALGLAAAVGLILLLIGAVTSHLRAAPRFADIIPALLFAVLTIGYGLLAGSNL